MVVFPHSFAILILTHNGKLIHAHHPLAVNQRDRLRRRVLHLALIRTKQKRILDRLRRITYVVEQLVLVHMFKQLLDFSLSLRLELAIFENRAFSFNLLFEAFFVDIVPSLVKLLKNFFAIFSSRSVSKLFSFYDGFALF
jgi:hypothetical protein